MRGTTLPSPGPDGEPGQLTSAASSPERPRKLVERALGVVSDPVGGRDQQPERELRPPRLCQEFVHVVLGDPVGGVIRLGLDRPQVPFVVLGDQVDIPVSMPHRPSHSSHSHTHRS